MDNGIVESYAPLADVKGSYTAQFEHVRIRSKKSLPKLISYARQSYFTVVGKR